MSWAWRWWRRAARHWRKPAVRTFSLLEAAIQYGHIHVADRSLRQGDVGRTLFVVGIFRSMIRALHRGYMHIFNGILAVCRFKGLEGFFLPFCVSDGRSLFLSQPIDMRIWGAESRRDVWRRFCSTAWPSRDMEIIQHVAGPHYVHVQMRLTHDNVASVAHAVDVITAQVHEVSSIDAIVALIACNGDVVDAITTLKRRDTKRRRLQRRIKIHESDVSFLR